MRTELPPVRDAPFARDPRAVSLLHLGVATVVLAVVSLSWAVAVDLTLAGERPYVGSSPNDSVLGLISGYNGFDRLSGVSSGSGGESIPAGAPGGPGGGTMELGDPGPLRLLNGRLAGQASWLLPLAVVGLLAAVWQRGRPVYRSTASTRASCCGAPGFSRRPLTSASPPGATGTTR